MRCNTCHTQGVIIIAYKMFPCPDCHGGHQHCCDGEDWCHPEKGSEILSTLAPHRYQSEYS